MFFLEFSFRGRPQPVDVIFIPLKYAGRQLQADSAIPFVLWLVFHQDGPSKHSHKGVKTDIITLPWMEQGKDWWNQLNFSIQYFISDKSKHQDRPYGDLHTEIQQFKQENKN